MSTEDIPTTPVEVDTRIAAIYDELARARHQIARYLYELHIHAGDKRTQLPTDPGRSGRFASGPWGMTDAEVLNLSPDTLDSFAARQFEATSREYHDLVERTNTLCTELDELDAVFIAAGGWTRFYLVTNVNGHIHRTRPDRGDRCQTCYPDTPFGWLTALSGRTEADAVRDIGPVLCSMCFKDAPVEDTNGELHVTREEREARRAEKATRADAKRAKALENALFEGAPERFVRTPGYPDRISTIRAARTWLKDGFEWSADLPDGRKHHSSYPPATGLDVAEALAARTGTTVAEVLADAEKRAQPGIRKSRKAAAEFLARNPQLAR
jgi:hypothetical protein